MAPCYGADGPAAVWAQTWGGGKGLEGGWVQKLLGLQPHFYPAESLLQHGVRLWALGFGLRPGELPVEQLLSAGQRRAALRRG